MTNLGYLRWLLTGHGNAITGRVGSVQFPQASLGLRLQGISSLWQKRAWFRWMPWRKAVSCT